MAERRITNTVGTIPNYTALAGTVTSQTDTKVLIYSGSDDIDTALFDGGVGLDSTYWIYVPAGTPKIAKIIGTYKIGTGNWNIQLDRAMTGASGSACNFVKEGVAFSYINDGGADGSIGDGSTQITIPNGGGGTYAPYEKYSNRQKLQPVKYVVATGTSFLIQEEV